MKAIAKNPRLESWITELYVDNSQLKWLMGGSGNIIEPGKHSIAAQVATLNTFLNQDASQLEQKKIVDLTFPGFLILKDLNHG